TEVVRLREGLEALRRTIDINTQQQSAGQNVRLPGTAAQSLPPTTAGTTPQPIQTAPAQQNITVNANVKGGIIDAETTRAITDIIRREIRRGTAPSAN